MVLIRLLILVLLAISTPAAAYISGPPGGGGAFSSPEITKAFLYPTYSLASGAAYKIPLDTVKFDKHSAWDATNKRIKPTTTGYYQVDECIGFNTTSGSYVVLYLYKNGGMIDEAWAHGSSANPESICLSDIVYMNGSTDYLEMYATQNTGASQTVWGSTDGHNTFLSVVFVGN